MSSGTLYDKVWDAHRVTTLPNGQDQLFIGLHLVHEVTSPQAFAALRELGKPVAYPQRTIATMDHIIPTVSQSRPFPDSQAEAMAQALEKNTADFGIQFLNSPQSNQGIVHVVGPEMGLTQPGMTIACGDSHTSTHGALGSLAFGIGSTEVHHVLQTQTLAANRLKVKRIVISGELGRGVYPKDVILRIIQQLGVAAGLGYAYEYAGSVVDAMGIEGRLTLCNMSIEGGARIGYVNPDEVTLHYLKGRPFSPTGEAWDRAVLYWQTIRSDANATYDATVDVSGGEIEPMVTWGITPAQSVGVTQRLPMIGELPDTQQSVAKDAYGYMNFKEGTPILGTKIDVAFMGSCTNSRLSDLEIAASVLRHQRVHPSVRAMVVPGSYWVKAQAEAAGLHEVFLAAGAEWREPGCSMCLAMNPDRLVGNEVCASTSNRNFMGRQGSPTGRTLLMSPAMVAAAAVAGRVVDCREYVS